MKSLRVLFGLAILAIATSVQAGQNFVSCNSCDISTFRIQNPQMQQMSPEERAKQETEWMKKDLELNAQQLVKVDSINLKFAKKRSEMRSQMQGQDRETMMAKMQEMQSQKETELKSVLTEDQLKKYKELVIQRRANRGQGRGN
jgi:hypothetical protein